MVFYTVLLITYNTLRETAVNESNKAYFTSGKKMYLSVKSDAGSGVYYIKKGEQDVHK